jgi:hypothetical protein
LQRQLRVTPLEGVGVGWRKVWQWGGAGPHRPLVPRAYKLDEPSAVQAS